MTLEVETARLIWPGIGIGIAVGIISGQPAMVLELESGRRIARLTPQQCEIVADALEAAADIAEGIIRPALTSDPKSGILDSA